jgi:hypothetical protein
MVLCRHLGALAEAAECRGKAMQLRKSTVINMKWLLLPISQGPIIVVDPPGLLLVISHLWAVSVYGWGRKINK